MENLNGTIAMVNGASVGTSKEMRIGIISLVDVQTGHADITFASLQKERVALSEIHLLKDRHTLYQMLMSTSASIPLGDFKTLFKVNMLQDRGDPSSLLDAFQILKSSPTAAAMATDQLDERLGFNRSVEPSTNKAFHR
ncbi:MAG: hypothetical protein EOO90_29285 [Pedobacter sp.]|nr:MAG: hypothetical protein EOO90_29285 [Pedobacter sp.]